MKVCLVHNEYGKFSGEEAVVQNQIALLRMNGHSVCKFERSSSEISDMFLGQVRAFFSGIYNPLSKKQFKKFLEHKRPNIVHIHNLYPFISPSILDVCADMDLPVTMTVHNYRLICPNGLFMVRGKVCERCSGGKEYNCIFKNCEESLLKSIGYALRNYFARVRKSYLEKVDMYAVLTDFQRCKLIEAGFSQRKIVIIPNVVDFNPANYKEVGSYIGYVGRISPEKGAEKLVSAAVQCKNVLFKAAGDFEKLPDLPGIAPSNFKFVGQLDRPEIEDFFQQSRAIVLCSTCYEGFPMVLVEAMLSGRPVIATRIGGIPEIVEDGVTGLLFEPGNVDDLAEKIRLLWNQPELCRQMGQAGRDKALREYSKEKYYQRLMDVYNRAITSCQN